MRSASYEEFRDYIASFTLPKSALAVKKLFADEKIKNNLKNAKFSCTGSEFMAIAPIMHRYLRNVVRSREQEDMLPYIDSMLAVLDVVMMLQSCRTGTIKPADLMTAITGHLVLFVDSWGEQYIRPKHHYALHLPDFLERFGYLLASFVHERKHRLINKYTRDRHNLRAYEAGAIEDVTCHQLWECNEPFYFAAKESQPAGLMRTVVEDLFPDISVDAIKILSDISLNGGRASSGDVVAFFQDGRMQIGRLLISLGISSTTPTCYSFIANWQQIKLDGHWITCTMSDNDVVKIESKYLDSVLINMQSLAESSCTMFLPPELRPQ